MIGDWNIVINEHEKTIVTGDTALALTVCGSESEYICYSYLGYSFSVPKDTAVAKWSFKGRKFAKIDTRYISILGNSYNVEIIESNRDGIYNRYYFSREKGLMWFSYREKGVGEVLYMLSGATGFGAHY